MAKKKIVRRKATEAEKELYRKAAAKAKRHEAEMRAEAAEIGAAIRLGRQVISDIRAERERQGVSLAELMERTGMTRAAISNLENNDSPNPTLRTLTRLATALNMKLEVGVKRQRA